jgi:mitogen-activated protein kinase 15
MVGVGSRYTKGVDMWSIGCILGELLGGKPMFPGTSTMNQLDRIIEVTGRPTSEDIEAIKSPFAANMLESLPPSQPRYSHTNLSSCRTYESHYSTHSSLSDIYPTAPDEALSLLRRLLQFSPDKRISAEEVTITDWLVAVQFMRIALAIG